MRGLMIDVLLAATALPAASQPVEGNLPADFYVKSSCPKPPPAPKPFSGNDPDAQNYYNFKVRKYNKLIQDSDACIRLYDKKAVSDIGWISYTVNSAVAAANGTPAPSTPPEPGNMPVGFYPKPSCIKPVQPGPAPSTSDVKAMETHNAEVRAYNAMVADFNVCLKTYTARAQTDLARIEAARRDANTPQP